MKQRIIDNIKIQIILTIISLGLVFFAHYLEIYLRTLCTNLLRKALITLLLKNQRLIIGLIYLYPYF